MEPFKVVGRCRWLLGGKVESTGDLTGIIRLPERVSLDVSQNGVTYHFQLAPIGSGWQGSDPAKGTTLSLNVVSSEELYGTWVEQGTQFEFEAPELSAALLPAPR